MMTPFRIEKARMMWLPDGETVWW